MVSSILPVKLEDAVVQKRGKRLVGPVSEEIGPHGFTVLMGPNGSGKTSLLRLLHGLERPGKGKITWPVGEDDAHRRQALVFQTPIMMRRSVLENIVYPLRVLGTPKDQASDKASKWAERIGLGDALDRNAQVLSGGEKQKLAIARALITEPDLLLLDEPTTNLDGAATREIEAILRQAYVDGIRIIMATHHLGQARRLATDVIFMYRGRVHERVSANAFFSKPATKEGRAFIRGDIVE